MSPIVSSDDTLVRALGDFCRAYMGAHTRVIRGYVNRVSKPRERDYVLITPMAMTRLSTNRHAHDPASGRETITQPMRRRVQIDVYGEGAADWAKTLTTLLRDGLGCRFLAAYGLAPLYVDDAQDMTQVEGNEQYNPRWMLGVMIQADESVSVDVDFFDDVNLGLHPQA